MADRKLRSFGVGVAAVFVLLGTLRLLHAGLGGSWWLLCVAAIMLLLALLVPGLLRPLYRVSLTVGRALGWFNSQLLLGVVYYFVVTPIALVIRLLGHDPLHRRLEVTRSSYWKAAEHQPDSDRYWERPF
jgi:hypothetical protein